MTPAPSLSLQTDVVQALRQSLWSNGFRPVAVYNAKYPMSSSPGKQPYGNEWQLGAQETPPRAVVELTLPFARNTGIWCGGLRAVDIDLEDEALAEKIEALSRQHLGQAPARTRANSAKRLLLYAAAVGEPKKRALTGSAGKIEVLGFGQQFVAYGTHPTGVNYEWRDSADPTTFNRADLSAVTEAQVEAFLDASRLVIGAAAETIQREVETSAPPSPNNTLARDRGRLLAAQALAEDAENLSAMGKDSGRNDALNGLAYRQGRFVAAGWIARSTVEQALQQACERNGIWIEDGPKACIATIRSGLDKGISAGPPSLADRGEPVAPILSIHGRPTASVLEAAPKAREDWPDPEPLPSGLLTVPAFSPAFLPQSIAPWVEDIADRMQAPPDFVAVPAVIALGSLIGRKVGIKPQMRTDWLEVPNLWGCIVGQPGEMKTPAMNQAMKPLNRLETEAREEHEAARKEFLLQSEAYKLRKEAAAGRARKALKTGDDISAELDIGEGPEAPRDRRYITQDTTYEALGEILQANPNGVLVFRDELVGLLRTLDSEDNAAARAFFLTAWNGTNGYSFDRIIRGKTHIPAACLSMVGSTQPGRLAEYISRAVKGGAGDDGLIQRFGLLVWPDRSSDWKDIDRFPDTEFRRAAWDTYTRLDGLTPAAVRAESDSFGSIPFLRLGNAAHEAFLGWRTKFENDLRSNDLPPSLASHFSKYRKLVPSLALINHLADGGTGPVGEAAMVRALAFREYLEAHARRCYGAASLVEKDAAERILKKIQSGALADGFSSRDVRRPQWTGLTDREIVARALDMLADHSWIEVETVPTSGRTKTIYRVNPKADGASRSVNQ